MKRLAWLLLCLIATGSLAVEAQDRSVSYSTWTVAANMVTLRFVLPVSEAQRLTGVAVPVMTTNRLEDYLLKHVGVSSAAGECPAIDQGFDLGRVDPLAVGAGQYGFEIFFRCVDPRHLVLRNSALFATAPGHINFARVLMRGHNVEQVFTTRQQQLTLPEDGALAPAPVITFVRLGLTHIFSGADRWIFLASLLLLVRRRREMAWVALALTLGYALSLALAMTQWVVPRASVIEGFMGLLVGLAGVLVIQRENGDSLRPARAWITLLLVVAVIATLRSAFAAAAILGGAALSGGVLALARRGETRLTAWPGLVVLFSFLDGFALPALLGPAELSRPQQARILFGFDLGALLMALILIALAGGGWMLWRTLRWAAPRALLHDVCAAGLAGLGTFWLLSRL